MNRRMGLMILILFGVCCNGRSKKVASLVESVQISKNKVTVRANKSFAKNYLLQDFFVEHEGNIDLRKLDRSLVVIPFVMNVITIVWASGKKYTIDSLDEDLYYSLKRIKEVFRRVYPKTSWNGELIPKKIVKNKLNSPNRQISIAIPFSHGLDSLCTSLLHADQKQLLITVCGPPDVPLSMPDAWQSLRNKVQNFAREYGHNNSFLRSNYHSFLNYEKLKTLSPEIISWRRGALEGLAWSGLVSLAVYFNGCSELLIPSTYTWDYSYFYSSCPLVDDNIRFAGVRVKHDAYDLSRADKCQYIHDFYVQRNKSFPYVKVCGSFRRGLDNCTSCNKCLGAINCLLALGLQPKDFGFDISVQDVETALKKVVFNFDYATKCNFWLFELSGIIKKIEQRKDAGEQLSPYLQWLLDTYDEQEALKIVSQIRTYKIMQPFDVRKFQDLLPSIPEKYLV